MRFRPGLYGKLALVLLLFAALLLLGIGAMTYAGGRAALKAAALAELAATANEKQNALATVVEERQENLTALAAWPPLREEIAVLTTAAPNSTVAQAAHGLLVQDLQSQASSQHGLAALYLLAPGTGQIVASTRADEEGEFREDRPYFMNGQHALFVQNPEFSLKSQNFQMTFAVPVQSAEGRLVGVLAGDVTMDEINALVTQRTGLHQTDDAFLVNTANLFVTQPRLLSDPAVLRLGIHTVAAQRCLAHNSGEVEANDYRGVPVIIQYRWLPERQLCLIVKLDQTEAFAPVRAFALTLAVISGLALLVAAMLALWLARAITSPVLTLHHAVEQFGRGQWEQPVPVKTSDELGQLALAFNGMAASLRRSQEELEQRVQDRTAQLRESEARFRSVLDDSVDVIYRVNLQTGAYDYISPSCEAIMGFSAHELMSQSVETALAMVHPDDLPGIQAAHALAEQTGSATVEYRQRTKSGGYCWLSNHLSITRDQAGRPLYRDGNLRDVTERKQAEEALRESESKFAAMFQNAPMAIALSSLPNGVLVDVNAAYEKLFGYSKEEAIGRTSLELGIVPDPQVREQLLAQIRQQGFAHNVELVYRTKRGLPLVICGNIDQVTINGEKYILNTFEDITERKRAEQVIREQQEQLQAQNEELTAQGEVLQAQNEELTMQREELQAQNEELVAQQIEIENQQRRLEAVLEALPVGVAIADAEGRKVQANAAFEQIWGGPLPVGADYPAFHGWWLETGQPVAPHEWASAQAIQTGLTVADQVFEIQRFDGSRAVVINSAAPVRDAQGQIIGAAVSIQDITTLKKAEGQLAYQARLLSRVHDAIIGMDEQLRITYWNQVAQEMYGWTEAEALGLTTNELFQSEPIGPDWAEAAQTLQRTDQFEGEVYHQRKDGTVILVHTRSATIRDSQGNFKGVVTSIRDITTRRRLEDELREARDELEARVLERTAQLEEANAVLEEEIEERRNMQDALHKANAYNRGLLEASPDPLVTISPEGKIGDVNAATEQATGRLRDALIGTDFSDYFTEPDKARAGYRRVFTDGMVRDYALEIRHQDGHTTPVLYNASVYRDPVGQISGVFAAARDITERVRSEQERQRAEDEIRRLNTDLEQALAQEQAMHQQLMQAEKLGALGRMVSSVAHEFNNPLQTVTNCLYLTASELPPDSVIHQYLEMAGAETERMVRLVAQLRELYRPRTIPPETHDLAQLLQSVHALMAPQLQSGHVQWLEPAALAGYRVCVIPDRIKQVLINVATNAIEAMQPAGGQLRVALAPSADGRQVGVRFEDTGPGIPPENLGRLFEPFFTTKAQGLGLGLAICYEIAQQHGGQITAESQPGQGAVFTVWLPLVQPADGG